MESAVAVAASASLVGSAGLGQQRCLVVEELMFLQVSHTE
jgi:hypothetical protein